MAPIHTLPFEIVHAIITFITSGDLSAVALVSRTFNAAATPHIYENIQYTSALVRDRAKILCPLELISARSDLLAHLKTLQIDTIPWEGGIPHPGFTDACLHVVEHAPALTSFSWGRVQYHITFRDQIRHMADSLRQAALMFGNSPPLLEALLFKRLGCIKRITLGYLSKGGNQALVEWVTSNPRPCLTSLTISRNFYLSSTELGRMLANTPNLKSLSITASENITPSTLFPLIVPLELESLELNINSSSLELPTIVPPLPALHHVLLAITPPTETGADQGEPLTQGLFLRIFEAIQNLVLHSLTFHLRMSRSLTADTITALLNFHERNLRRLNLFGLYISARSIADIIRRALHLELLGVQLRKISDELDVVVEVLPAAHHLHAIIDTTPRPYKRSRPDQPVQINTQVEQILRAGPALRYVVSPQWGDEWEKSYIWTDGQKEVVISRRHASPASDSFNSRSEL